MKRAGAVCPRCGSKTRPYKEKINGQDTQDLICADCGHIDFWIAFQPKDKEANKEE